MLKRRTWLMISILTAVVLFVAACAQQAPATTEPPVAQKALEPTTVAEKAPAMMDTGKTMRPESAPTTDMPQGTVWVANGMEDSLSAVDLATGQVLTTVPVGINPHILNVSPDGRILYVINAGQHDRQPAAHGSPEGKMDQGQEMEQPGGMDKDMDQEMDQSGGMMDEDMDQGMEQPGGMGQEMGRGGHAGGMGNTGGMMQPQAPSTQPDDDMMDAEMGMDQEAKANSLWAIDATSGEVLARVPVGQGPTHPIPSPDGRWVYVTNTDEGSVSVIDTTTWQVVATITDLPEPHDGELTPDGRLLYLATAGDNTMTVVDTATRRVTQTFPVGKKPRGVAAGGPNGEIAYVTNKGDGTLSVIDVAAGEVKATLFVGKGAHAVRVSPDGTRVYVALSKEDAVAVVDPVAGKVLTKIPVGKTPEQIDLGPDGRWLIASNNGDATISIVDVAQGEVVKTVSVGEGAYGVQATLVALQAQAKRPAMAAVPMFPKNADGFADITVQQLAQMLPNKNFTMVNVHIPYEGELPQTDLFIPFNEIAENLDKLPDKDAPIVIYCRSGRMSTEAARTLAKLGYTNIMELDGGFNAWKAAGYELLMRERG